MSSSIKASHTFSKTSFNYLSHQGETTLRTSTNMNSMTIAVFVAVAVAVASAQIANTPVPIVQYDDTRDEAGQYSLRYITGDGTVVTEFGKLKPNAEGDEYVLVKEGSYSYVGDDGKTYSLKYIADEKGFQPTADHIPVAPTA